MKTPVTKTIVSKLDVKSTSVDMIIENNLAFNFLDSQSYIAHVKSLNPAVEICCGSAIKNFVQTNAIVLRNHFKDEILPDCPGLFACVEEWSDITMIPWMGIVIMVVLKISK